MVKARAIAVVSDLIFSSKISGTARALGIDAVVVSKASILAAALEAGDVALVIVDMSLSGDESLAALRCSASHTSRPTSIAFYSHVQLELKNAALEAGADLVLARSQFSEQLPQLLAQYCGGAK